LFPVDVQRDGDTWRHNETGAPVTAGRIEKMSKSKRNVVDPEVIIGTFGADTARLFMLSDSPPERDMEWTESGVEGASRFLKRIFRMASDAGNAAANSPLPKDGPGLELVRAAHKAIDELTKDIENFRFNRAVAQLHTLANAIADCKGDDDDIMAGQRFAVETMARLISPLAPHIAEEMWEALGNKTMLATSDWPEADPSLVKDDMVEIGVQVNGKLRGTIELPHNCDKEDAQRVALASPAIVRYLDGQTPKKVIVVPNRIINVVL